MFILCNIVFVIQRPHPSQHGIADGLLDIWWPNTRNYDDSMVGIGQQWPNATAFFDALEWNVENLPNF